jgi:CheY-like chemotaxis protein
VSVTGVLRIVVCEDDPDIREMFEELLRLRGYEVDSTGSGLTALDLMLGQQFDVALIDIGLPDIDGYEVATRIRRELGHRAPWLVAVTGFVRAIDRERARSAGFDRFVVKPATAGALFDAIRVASDPPAASIRTN